MVQGDEGEGEESPEDEGVGDAGERALAMTLAWQRTSQTKSQMRRPRGMQGEAEVFFEREDGAEDGGEAEKKRLPEAATASSSSAISRGEKFSGSLSVSGRAASVATDIRVPSANDRLG